MIQSKKIHPEEILAKKILALDSAMNGCGACIYTEGSLFPSVRPMPRGQAEHLIPLVEAVLEQSGLAYKDLEAIATTIGPGAFTGLRIGLSTAKALGVALGIPVFGITTLQVLALDYIAKEEPEHDFGVVIETKRQDFYTQTFDRTGKALGKAKACPAKEVETMPVFIGDAVLRFAAERPDIHVIEGYTLPDPALIAKALADTPAYFTEEPAPLYLRPPDVSAPKKKPRVLAERSK